MPTLIDHVVVVVRDLDAAIADAGRAGFTVRPGGEHAGGATHNALIAFADGSYVELIAFRQPDEPQAHKWWPRLAKGEGLVDFALLSSDLAAEAQEINDRGFQVPAPSPNGRLRPDGERLEWRAVQTQKIVGESGLPFIIEDVTPRALRVATDADSITHPNGVTGIAGVSVVVENLTAASPNFAALLGVDGMPSGEDAESIGAGRRFPIGAQWVELIEPAAADLDRGTDDGRREDITTTNPDTPSRYLARYGNGPFEVILRTGDPHASPPGPRTGDLLDTGLMHGARFRLAGEAS